MGRPGSWLRTHSVRLIDPDGSAERQVVGRTGDLVQDRLSPRGTNVLLLLRDTGEPFGKRAVQWATDALSDGHDVPSIRLLAGLDLEGLPSSPDAGALLEAALRELQLPETDLPARALEYLRDVAAAIVAREIAPQEGANEIHRLVIGPLGHPADLQGWCYLWEGNAADCSRVLEEAEIDQAIVDYATAFLAAAQPVVAADGASLPR
jgi:hypothetical protein